MTVATRDLTDLDAFGSPDRGHGPNRAWIVVPWVLTLLLLLVAGFTTLRWLELQEQADTRDAVGVAATAFLVDLVNWDATDGLDDTVESLRARGTGRFLAQAEDLLGGPVGDDLEIAGAVSEGRIEDLFVQSIDGARAEAFAVVSQGVRSTLTDGTERSIRRVIMHLERVDGAWLVENLELPELIEQPPTGDGDS